MSLKSFFGGSKKQDIDLTRQSSTVLPDVLEVVQKEEVTIDEYLALHSVASKLEERSKASRLQEMENDIQTKTRALKLAVGLIVLAVFLPGLFNLVLTLLVFGSLLLGGIFYYYEIQPFHQHITQIFVSIGNIFSSVNSSSVSLARAKLEADLGQNANVRAVRGRSPRRRK